MSLLRRVWEAKKPVIPASEDWRIETQIDHAEGDCWNWVRNWLASAERERERDVSDIVCVHRLVFCSALLLSLNFLHSHLVSAVYY